MNEQESNSVSERLLIPGVDFIFPNPRPTTLLGIEACFRWALSAKEFRDDAVPWASQLEGVSAGVSFRYGSAIPNRKPYSPFRGAGGWLRVQHLRASPGHGSDYLLSSAFNDSDEPVLFDLLEVFFDHVDKVESCPVIPAVVEARFTTELARHSQISLADWQRTRRQVHDDLIRELQSEAESIKRRLSQLRAELVDARFPTSLRKHPDLDGDSSTVAGDSQVAEMKAEQLQLRERLLLVEDREMEEKRRDPEYLSFPKFFVKTLFTIRWQVNSSRPQRDPTLGIAALWEDVLKKSQTEPSPAKPKPRRPRKMF